MRKSIVWGLVAAGLLLLFYWLVLSLANSFDHAVQQWNQWWFWISLLVVGFGVQVGLYSYVRNEIRERKKNGVGGKLAATGGVSAGSMVACCAHHVVDVLPIIGLSATALFLAEYQQFFMVVGVVGNLIGIVYILEIIRRHELYQEGSTLEGMLRFDVTQLKRWVIVGSVAVLVFMFLGTYKTSEDREDVTQVASLIEGAAVVEAQASPEVALSSKTNTGGGLTVEVTSAGYVAGEPVRFEVIFNTHQGDLNFDLTKQSVLVDDAGNEYLPVEWQGGTGGHHLSGQLIFPSINSEATKITLVISDIYEVKERMFEWDLNSS